MLWPGPPRTQAIPFPPAKQQYQHFPLIVMLSARLPRPLPRSSQDSPDPAPDNFHVCTSCVLAALVRLDHYAVRASSSSHSSSSGVACVTIVHRGNENACLQLLRGQTPSMPPPEASRSGPAAVQRGAHITVSAETFALKLFEARTPGSSPACSACVRTTFRATCNAVSSLALTRILAFTPRLCSLCRLDCFVPGPRLPRPLPLARPALPAHS